jgi:hypothetical protein
MLATLKFLTILATALFGILGSLIDFKDKKGRVNRYGWVALVGTIVAGTSAAALQIYSEIEQEEIAQAVLHQASRAVHPLEGLKAAYSLAPSWTKPEFSRFFKEVEAAQPRGQAVLGMRAFVDQLNTPLMRWTVCGLDAQLFFFKEKINVSQFKLAEKRGIEDLRVTLRNNCHQARSIKDGSPYGWRYYSHDTQLLLLEFELWDKPIETTSTDWESNGKITSLQDLLGSQLVVYLAESSLPTASEGWSEEKIDEYRQTVKLVELVLRLRSGVVLAFDSNNLIQSKTQDGLSVYSFNFPHSINELVKVAHYDSGKRLPLE